MSTGEPEIKIIELGTGERKGEVTIETDGKKMITTVDSLAILFGEELTQTAIITFEASKIASQATQPAAPVASEALEQAAVPEAPQGLQITELNPEKGTIKATSDGNPIPVETIEDLEGIFDKTSVAVAIAKFQASQLSQEQPSAAILSTQLPASVPTTAPPAPLNPTEPAAASIAPLPISAQATPQAAPSIAAAPTIQELFPVTEATPEQIEKIQQLINEQLKSLKKDGFYTKIIEDDKNFDITNPETYNIAYAYLLNKLKTFEPKDNRFYEDFDEIYSIIKLTQGLETVRQESANKKTLYSLSKRSRTHSEDIEGLDISTKPIKALNNESLLPFVSTAIVKLLQHFETTDLYPKTYLAYILKNGLGIEKQITKETPHKDIIQLLQSELASMSALLSEEERKYINKKIKSPRTSTKESTDYLYASDYTRRPTSNLFADNPTLEARLIEEGIALLDPMAEEINKIEPNDTIKNQPYIKESLLYESDQLYKTIIEGLLPQISEQIIKILNHYSETPHDKYIKNRIVCTLIDLGMKNGKEIYIKQEEVLELLKINPKKSGKLLDLDAFKEIPNPKETIESAMKTTQAIIYLTMTPDERNEIQREYIECATSLREYNQSIYYRMSVKEFDKKVINPLNLQIPQNLRKAIDDAYNFLSVMWQKTYSDIHTDHQTTIDRTIDKFMKNNIRDPHLKCVILLILKEKIRDLPTPHEMETWEWVRAVTATPPEPKDKS
ncbi:MAG: hypothetical protein WC806_00255 [Candidatus Gracilibacteria bacterium]|jgi:hypothetical protein